MGLLRGCSLPAPRAATLDGISCPVAHVRCEPSGVSRRVARHPAADAARLAESSGSELARARSRRYRSPFSPLCENRTTFLVQGMPLMGRDWTLNLLRLALAGLTLACLSPVYHCDFVNFDDGRYVTDNPHVQEGLTVASLTWAWTDFRWGMYAPLTR